VRVLGLLARALALVARHALVGVATDGASEQNVLPPELG
jgi:hypothetical protein